MIEKIALGLIVSALGALLVYAFRVRQLYVVIPRLFSVSSITTNGKLVEIRAYNKGRVTEEDIEINLDPGIKYDVVASSDASCTLSQATLKIPRIPPGDDFSVLLLVEGGDFSHERISTISSKSTKGKLLQGIENVPPNAGSLLIVAFGFIAALALPIAGLNYYFEWKKSTEERFQAERLARLEYLLKDGWSQLEDYSASKFRDNYADGEFPIHLSGISRKGDIVEIRFRIVNKAAAQMQVTAFSDWPYKNEDPKIWEDRNIFSHKVEAQDANNLTIKLYYPKGKKGDAMVTFRITVGAGSTVIAAKRVAVAV